MVLENTFEFRGLQGDQTSPSYVQKTIAACPHSEAGSFLTFVGPISFPVSSYVEEELGNYRRAVDPSDSSKRAQMFHFRGQLIP